MKLYIGENTTIKKVKFTDNIIQTIMKHGRPQPYRAFKGRIKDKEVEGLVCLSDDNVYNLKHL